MFPVSKKTTMRWLQLILQHLERQFDIKHCSFMQMLFTNKIEFHMLTLLNSECSVGICTPLAMDATSMSPRKIPSRQFQHVLTAFRSDNFTLDMLVPCRHCSTTKLANTSNIDAQFWPQCDVSPNNWLWHTRHLPSTTKPNKWLQPSTTPCKHVIAVCSWKTTWIHNLQTIDQRMRATEWQTKVKLTEIVPCERIRSCFEHHWEPKEKNKKCMMVEQPLKAQEGELWSFSV